jgi:hypothetical protein
VSLHRSEDLDANPLLTLVPAHEIDLLDRRQVEKKRRAR